MLSIGRIGSGAVVAWVVTGVTWGIGERIVRARDLFSGRLRTGRQDRGTVWWVIVGAVAALGAGLGLATVHALDLPGAIEWLAVGLTIAWIGIGLRFWSVYTLGRFFTTRVTVQPGHEVVTTGPYRLVRHPSYLGLLLVLAGLGVALGNVGSLLAFTVFPVLGLLPRIHVEEAALQGALGERYEAYAKGRAHLVPHVW